MVTTLCLSKGATEIKYHINSYTWEQILFFLTQEKRIHTKDRAALRTFIEAIWYIVRSGCQWRLLPNYYGDWRAVHRRFKRWSDTGIWARLMQYVADPDEEAVMIDATIVRSHACSSGYGKDSQANEALGRGRGGFSTKIHAVVDSLGNPLKFTLTAGQRNEITQAEQSIGANTGTTVIADKGYEDMIVMPLLTSYKAKVALLLYQAEEIEETYVIMMSIYIKNGI